MKTQLLLLVVVVLNSLCYFNFLFQNVKLIQLAVSLGGVQSLIEVAGAMTHPEKYISGSDRQEGGLSESLIRLRYRCMYKGYVLSPHRRLYLLLLIYAKYTFIYVNS